MEFNQLVKKRRLELGLTMEELGTRVGVSKATIQRWESGEIKNVRRDKITKLAKALETTPSYLMGWEEANHTISDNSDATIAYLKEHGEDKLIELYKKIQEDGSLLMLMDKASELSPEAIAQILRIIDAL